MLAKNFKTPTDLGISDQDLSALVTLLGMLERKEVPYHKKDVYLDLAAPVAFNMSLGSCCLLGWARYIGGNELFKSFPPALNSLFCMFGNANDFQINERPRGVSHITPDEAAIALRNYLTTGVPNWEEVLEHEEVTQ